MWLCSLIGLYIDVCHVALFTDWNVYESVPPCGSVYWLDCISVCAIWLCSLIGMFMSVCHHVALCTGWTVYRCVPFGSVHWLECLWECATMWLCILVGLFICVCHVALYTGLTGETKMPAYLHSLLSERVPTCTLKSSSRPLLDVTRIKTVYGQRAFYTSAPNTWNSLPVDNQLACSLNIFKKCLKHFYSRLLSVSCLTIGTCFCIFRLNGTLNVVFNF